MCFQTADVVTSTRKSWEGDEIVNRPIIRAARFVPGTKKRYDIDIRQFLSNSSNAVVIESTRAALEQLSTLEEHSLVRSSRPGAFDLRVRAICGYLGRTLRYKVKRSDRGPDQWLFPDETLANGGGDCEDLAFLLAAMLLASGVSGYVIRVALGTFRDMGTGKDCDHAWVVYKTESGQWIILDPLLYTQASQKRPGNAAATGRAKKARSSFEYFPKYVFNDSHLWSVRKHPEDTLSFERFVRARETFWDCFDPTFATGVHNSILDSALAPMSWADRQYVKAVSLAVDANIVTYDPRDHFDNGYIDDGWALIHKRLKSGNLNDFALACHSISDFYAHTTWGVFGARVGGKLQTYNASAPRFQRFPDYSEDGILPFTNKKRFTVNERVWTRTRAEAAEAWSGQIISGRYAQSSDPHQGTFERLTYIPKGLRDRPDYQIRTGLPHHNEIAVDHEHRDEGHRLYTTTATYTNAFRERYETARTHIAQVYASWQAQHERARAIAAE
jgi:hypothetical protein